MNIVSGTRRVRAVMTGLVLLCSGIVFAQEDDPKIKGKPVSKWIEQLRGKNRGLQVRAARALSAAPTNLHSRIAPQVIPVLKSERENDKFVAAQILGEYGPAARAAIPDLLPMLKGTQYERNRAAAAKALGQILKDAKPDKEVDTVTAALIEVFTDQYDDVRREAVTACGMIGPAAKACIPHLTPRLNEQIGYPPKPVAVAAAWTCERMGPLAKEHVDLLIGLMHRVMGYTPAYISALGGIGPVHKNVVPNLMDNMEQYTSWHLESWQVLQKFSTKAEEVIPFAKRFLANATFYGANNGPHRELVVIEAMKFLQVAGPKAVDALPEVERLIHYKHEFDKRPLMKKEAAKTAGILKGLAGGSAKKAAPGDKEGE
ncbi:HEAT repeat domain-containing protein [Planctomycetota bacterium]